MKMATAMGKQEQPRVVPPAEWVRLSLGHRSLQIVVAGNRLSGTPVHYGRGSSASKAPHSAPGHGSVKLSRSL